MDVYLDVLLHVIFSILAAYFAWKFYFPKDKSKLKLSVFFALISGVLIDLDHLIDYFLAFGRHFDFFQFMSSESFLTSNKVYVLFHAYEYFVILGIIMLFVKKKKLKMIFLSLFLSMLFHFAVDIMFGVPMQSYFLTYRLAVGFNRTALSY